VGLIAVAVASLLANVFALANAHSGGSPDLFVNSFGDAFDFSNTEDVAITPNTTFGMTNASISGGQFHADLSGPSWIALLWRSIHGVITPGRAHQRSPFSEARRVVSI
jgi:hypothetical protein